VSALQSGADDYVTKRLRPRSWSRACRPPAARRARRDRADDRGRRAGDRPCRACRQPGRRGGAPDTAGVRPAARARFEPRLLMTHRKLLTEVWVPGVRGRTPCCARTSRTCAASSRPEPIGPGSSAPIRDRLPLQRLSPALAGAGGLAGRPVAGSRYQLPPAAVADATADHRAAGDGSAAGTVQLRSGDLQMSG